MAMQQPPTIIKLKHCQRKFNNENAVLGPTYERENEANSLKLHSVCPASVFQCAHRNNKKKRPTTNGKKITNNNNNLGRELQQKKSGKERHKSVNDHEQQTNLLRADCKFVDIHQFIVHDCISFHSCSVCVSLFRLSVCAILRPDISIGSTTFTNWLPFCN